MVVTIEALFGLVMLALGTSLMFSKFSQPRARVTFSRFAVVTVRDGQQVLMVRVANERTTGLVEAQMHLVLVRDEITKEGEAVRRFHSLALQRNLTAIFANSWSVLHVIDERSALFGETVESLRATRSDLVASLIGIEEATAQQVHARYSWNAEEILFGRRFRDILVHLPDGRRGLDYALFHELDPLPGEEPGDGDASDGIKSKERARSPSY
jgi:inward rectifier potassium channel